MRCVQKPTTGMSIRGSRVVQTFFSRKCARLLGLFVFKTTIMNKLNQLADHDPQKNIELEELQPYLDYIQAVLSVVADLEEKINANGRYTNDVSGGSAGDGVQ